MIKVKFNIVDYPTEKEIEINHFPDGTQRLGLEVPDFCHEGCIYWKYSSDEEMITLFYIVNHIRQHNKNCSLSLILNYIPNSRLDRVKNKNEVFTLKYFCDFINSLNFDSVTVIDPHSDVSAALLNNVVIFHGSVYAQRIYGRLIDDDTIARDLCVFFPDYGAMKRYSDIRTLRNVYYGEKVREWETGKILSLDIMDVNTKSNVESVKNKNFLIIDDIISYGGTMYHSVNKLKELGANKIYIYCSHLENSVLDKDKGTLIKLLDNGTVEKLYALDTLFTGKHDRIEIINF